MVAHGSVDGRGLLVYIKIYTVGGFAMNTAKVFRNGRSQAVRLPKEFQFDADEVYVNKVGDMVVLFPKKKGWDILAESIGHFTGDYMADRDQPDTHQKRRACDSLPA